MVLGRMFHKLSFMKPNSQTTYHSSLHYSLLKQRNIHINPKFLPNSKLVEHPINLNHPILCKLKICKHMKQFNQIHGLTITTGLFCNVFAASRLVLTSAFFLDPPNITLAYLLFREIQNPDVYTYNTMIKAFSQTPNPIYSLILYKKMLVHCLVPNEYTFCFLFTSCGHGFALKEGQQVQSHFLKHGCDIGVFASTSLIHMYGQCGELNKANQAFDEMPKRSDVSWGAMIKSYISQGLFIDGLRLFEEMRSLGIEASNGTLVSILGACAKFQNIVLGRMVHGYIDVRGLELNVTLGTSLVDMYSKCGAIEEATNVFSVMRVKSVASWNCMMCGMAMNGKGDSVINLFKEMQTFNVKPNSTTFVGVLHSCSHAGLVSDGFTNFTDMNEVYGISANIKHYGCMVDLYGRAGRLKDALEVIRTMPMNPDIVIWGALLGACRIHGFSKLGELVVTQIIKLQPLNIAGSIGLSNMYAMAGQWDNVSEARSMMIDMDIVREPGFSSVTS